MTNHFITRRQSGFTLVELLVVVLILGILFAISASAMANLEANARVERTKTLIMRIDAVLTERYDAYLTRAIPIKYTPGMNGKAAATLRLLALRELMRMEFPDRQGDLDYGASPQVRVKYLSGVPSITRAYRKKVAALENSTGQNWTPPNESAECLYLILSMIRDGDKTFLDQISAREIGNIDNDAVPEILDAWGNPICFLRWAPGYISNADPSSQSVITPQFWPRAGSSFSASDVTNPDPFDPLKLDSRWKTPGDFYPFALKPLVYSWGPDRTNGITEYDYSSSATSTIIAHYHYDLDNDPYYKLPNCNRYVGQPFVSGTGFQDNLTNHFLGAQQ